MYLWLPRSSDFFQGFLCQFVSPSRGILVFSPIFLLAMLGLVQVCAHFQSILAERSEVQSKTHTEVWLQAAIEWAEQGSTGDSTQSACTSVDSSLSPASAAMAPLLVGIEHDWFPLLLPLLAIPLSAATFALWFSPHGGWSYGPRLFQDCVPLFSLLLVPVAQFILGSPLALSKSSTTAGGSVDRQFHSVAFTNTSRLLDTPRKINICAKLLLSAALVTACASVIIQYIGAFAYNHREWNNRPCFEVRAAFAICVEDAKRPPPFSPPHLTLNRTFSQIFFLVVTSLHFPRSSAHCANSTLLRPSFGMYQTFRRPSRRQHTTSRLLSSVAFTRTSSTHASWRASRHGAKSSRRCAMLTYPHIDTVCGRWRRT